MRRDRQNILAHLWSSLMSWCNSCGSAVLLMQQVRHTEVPLRTFYSRKIGRFKWINGIEDMSVSLFLSLVCLPQFEQNSGPFSLSIEHNRITQDVCHQCPRNGSCFLSDSRDKAHKEELFFHTPAWRWGSCWVQSFQKVSLNSYWWDCSGPGAYLWDAQWCVIQEHAASADGVESSVSHMHTSFHHVFLFRHLFKFLKALSLCQGFWALSLFQNQWFLVLKRSLFEWISAPA